MAKTVRIPLDVPEELREKAKKDSKALFGYVNVNGYLKHLLLTSKPKKS